MKFEIVEYKNRYYLKVNYYLFFEDIHDDFKTYNELLTKLRKEYHGIDGNLTPNDYPYDLCAMYFLKRSDAQRAIDECLVPLYVMNQLSDNKSVK